MGVVPQRERRPGTIVDYTSSGVNQEAAWGAPLEAMQFGKALERILQRILAANRRHSPTYMLKLDLSDGFYRIRLRAEDIPTLGVAFPVGPGEEPLIALPLTLPMGWTESHLAALPTPWWTSSIYMPPPPGTHHGTLWNLPRAHSPHWMVGTASSLPHPLSRHHLYSRYCHDSPRPSNAITADHWPMGMSLSMTKFCWHRAHQLNSNGSSAKCSTDFPGQQPPRQSNSLQRAYLRKQASQRGCLLVHHQSDLRLDAGHPPWHDPPTCSAPRVYTSGAIATF